MNCNRFNTPTYFRECDCQFGCGRSYQNFDDKQKDNYGFNQNGWGQECKHSCAESRCIEWECKCQPKYRPCRPEPCRPEHKCVKVKFEGIIKFC